MAKKRNTIQKEIIKKVIDNTDSFFTAEDLHKLISANYKGIGIATVYRFLNELLKQNQIFSYTCRRKAIYSKTDKCHCHFICEKTGKIIHFKVDSLDFLRDKIPGSIKSFQIEVKGVCDGKCKHCPGSC